MIGFAINLVSNVINMIPNVIAPPLNGNDTFFNKGSLLLNVTGPFPNAEGRLPDKSTAF